MFSEWDPSFIAGELTEDDIERSGSSEEEILEESLIALPSLDSARKKRLSLVRERVASSSHTDFDAWPFLSKRSVLASYRIRSQNLILQDIRRLFVWDRRCWAQLRVPWGGAVWEEPGGGGHPHPFPSLCRPSHQIQLDGQADLVRHCPTIAEPRVGFQPWPRRPRWWSCPGGRGSHWGKWLVWFWRHSGCVSSSCVSLTIRPACTCFQYIHTFNRWVLKIYPMKFALQMKILTHLMSRF